VNEQFEGFAKAKKDDEAIAEMIHYRKNKLFGEVNVYDEESKIAGIAFFKEGVCVELIPIKLSKNRNRILSKATIHSDKVEFKKCA